MQVGARALVGAVVAAVVVPACAAKDDAPVGHGDASDAGESSSGGGSPAGGASARGGTSGATGGASGATGGGGEATGGVGASGDGGASGGSAGGGTSGSAGDGAGSGGSAGMAGSAGTGGSAGMPKAGLSWPIDCTPDDTCVNIGYPDIDEDGSAFDCSEPGYTGHEGTDIGISFGQMDAGTAVRAAADGTVWFASDGKYDRCPNDDEPDCQDPDGFAPGATTGTTVCTELGPYCSDGGAGQCFWCFAGGNVIVILHDDVPGVFATRYDHLKRGSVLVEPGERVTRGQKIAEVGSAGASTGPHLHFEVWSSGYYVLAEPWAGECGPNHGPSLWANDPPWP